MLALHYPLEPNEMHGPIPATILSGKETVATLQKVTAPEHLHMLAEFGERKARMSEIIGHSTSKRRCFLRI